jgi:hypothetical protein
MWLPEVRGPVMALQWVSHRYSGQTADVPEGHYLVQADPIYRLGRAYMRYAASLIRRRQPSVRLGYFDSPDEAKQACELSNVSRWDEDMEAGAIG